MPQPQDLKERAGVDRERSDGRFVGRSGPDHVATNLGIARCMDSIGQHVGTSDPLKQRANLHWFREVGTRKGRGEHGTELFPETVESTGFELGAVASFEKCDLLQQQPTVVWEIEPALAQGPSQCRSSKRLDELCCNLASTGPLVLNSQQCVECDLIGRAVAANQLATILPRSQSSTE